MKYLRKKWKQISVALIIIYILSMVSILPLIGLPYDSYDWHVFAQVYLDKVLYLPLIVR